MHIKVRAVLDMACLYEYVIAFFDSDDMPWLDVDPGAKRLSVQLDNERQFEAEVGQNVGSESKVRPGELILEFLDSRRFIILHEVKVREGG